MFHFMELFKDNIHHKKMKELDFFHMKEPLRLDINQTDYYHVVTVVTVVTVILKSFQLMSMC